LGLINSFPKLISKQGTCPADLIRRLVDLVNYEGYLKHKDPEWASRWENVQELINFASEVPTEDMNGVSSEGIQTGDESEGMKYGSFNTCDERAN
jgi:DNA helicase-2/ATP-dependent DNA helicase PcrA